MEENKRMSIVRKVAMATGLVMGIALHAMAQNDAKVATLASSKFAAFPGAPACMTLSVQRGDPTKGAAVILAKFTAGCTVPWHWHSAGENLSMVSGRAKIEMKGAASSALAAGDYVYLPPQHQHLFTCVSACTLFDATEGAFDIHYVDKDGK